MPAPSPTTRPSPAPSKGEQTPEGDNARSWLKPIWVYMQSGRETPPVIMASARPARSSSTASLSA
ncbi:hypothetical protein D3C72_697130 [compost metagenome]